MGTTIETAFKRHLQDKYEMEVGNAASGIDLPSVDILTDIKVTSIKQPQSSCPFKEAKQKIYGLGYNLLVFVYNKHDDLVSKTSTLTFVSCSFVSKERTGDYTTTRRLREMVDDGANDEDILAYLSDRNMPADDITLNTLTAQVLQNPPEQGYLTISNALQWRLQYKRIVDLTEDIPGITRIVRYTTLE